MRRLLILAVCALSTLPAPAQKATEEEDAAVARLLGVDEVAELDADEYERYRRYLDHPVALNRASEATLSASGLFSPFQIASLLDYRLRSGDILSAAELARIDGFNSVRVAALRPFLSFEGRLAGVKTKDRLRGDLLLRTSPGKGKGRLGYGERIEAAWSPGGTAFLSLAGQRTPWRLILGDFKVRIGQGLVLWDGFSVSGLTSLEAFAKTRSGISPAWSWSQGTARRGVAGEYRYRKMRLLGWAGRDGVDGPWMIGSHLSWLLRRGQLSCTAFRKEAVPPKGRSAGKNGEVQFSLDGFYGFGSVEIFGEAAWEGVSRSAAFVGGLRGRLGERFSSVGALRIYPSRFAASSGGALRAGTRVADESGFSLGTEYRSERRITRAGVEGFGNSAPSLRSLLTLDAAVRGSGQNRQLKLHSDTEIPLSPFWQLSLRAQERLRAGYTPRHRGELRADLRWSDGRRISVTRLDAVRCEEAGLLAYQELGYAADPWRMYLRGTLFFCERWNDRIYAYERDAPGGFSVPAYYGRGWKVSLLAGWKGRPFRGIRTALYLHASYQAFPWTVPAKPPRGELRCQLSLSL